MAALVFEKLYTDSSNALSDVCIGNEPDNTITKFFIEAYRQGNRLGDVTLSNYDNINWQHSNCLMTSQNVSDIGIKTFPQIGAIGFYTLKYETRSLILAPIYTKSKKYAAPLMTVEDLDGTLRITFTDPEGATYECYRVVVRTGYFAEEYVTYEPVIYIPSPTDAGLYSVSAFGYLNEQLASQESDIQYITVAGEVGA
jgi:hypothetical protein